MMSLKPVVTWPLKEHTITAGTSWLQVASGKAVVASFRGFSELDSLRRTLQWAAQAHGTGRYVSHTPKAEICIQHPPNSGLHLTGGGVISPFSAETGADLDYWLHKCLHGTIPPHSPTAACGLMGRLLRLEDEGAQITVPVKYGELASFLFSAATITRHHVPPGLDCQDGYRLVATHAWSTLETRVRITARGPGDALTVQIGRGELTHLGMTAHHLEQKKRRRP